MFKKKELLERRALKMIRAEDGTAALLFSATENSTANKRCFDGGGGRAFSMGRIPDVDPWPPKIWTQILALALSRPFGVSASVCLPVFDFDPGSLHSARRPCGLLSGPRNHRNRLSCPRAGLAWLCSSTGSPWNAPRLGPAWALRGGSLGDV